MILMHLDTDGTCSWPFGPLSALKQHSLRVFTSLRQFNEDVSSVRRLWGASGCMQLLGFNHSPLSAWHTQGTAASSTHAATVVFCSTQDWNFSQTLLHNCSLEKAAGRLCVHKRAESTLVLRLERWLSLEQLQNQLPVHFICSGCSLKGRSRIKYWRGTRTTSPQEFHLTNACQPECTLTCALRGSKEIKFCLLNVLWSTLLRSPLLVRALFFLRTCSGSALMRLT